jgi:hypothetical protein
MPACTKPAVAATMTAISNINFTCFILLPLKIYQI